MGDKPKDTKKPKMTFTDPNSKKNLEKLLRLVIIEKIKNSNKDRFTV